MNQPAGRQFRTELRLGTPDLVTMDVLEIPAYRLEDGEMDISDVVWGHETIGFEKYDEILIQLARSPLFRRLQAVEQLSLPAEYTTVPNTSQFSRWQHLWGSLVFVRKMTRGDGDFSDRDRMILQLRTLLSDVGQTAFSHIGDFIFQEGSSSEDLHDQELRALLEELEVDKILEPHDITLDEVVFPDTQDWVECSSPDICVDRLDYGLREVLRWMPPTSTVHSYRTKLANPTSLFRINDQNMLEITDLEFAKAYARGHNLLSTEHHMQPVHRLQLILMQTAVKSALLDDRFSDGIELSVKPHPRDRMYGIDADFRFALSDWDRLHLSESMKSIGLAQRRIFATARREDISQALRDDIFPDPNQAYSWRSELLGLTAPSVELHQDDSMTSPIEKDKYGLKFNLPPLKARSIDPLVHHENQSVRLTQLDSRFSQYRNQQAYYMGLGYSALFLVNGRVTDSLYDMFQSISEQWPVIVDKPRSPDHLRDIVIQAGLYGAARRFDSITVE